MERFIHRENIKHYEKLLQTVTDEAERKRILMLLEGRENEDPTGRPTEKQKTAGIDNLLRLVVLPLPPVGRIHLDPRLGFGVDPAAKNAPRRKC